MAPRGAGALLAGAVLCGPCASLAQDPQAWTLELRSDRHSDGVPLADLDADDPLARLQPRSGRHLAYIDDEVRLSRRDGAWTWSLLARQSAVLVSGRDTLDLLLQASGTSAAAVDRQWHNRVRYWQFSGGGLEAGRTLALADGVAARFAVQGLVLQHWRLRRLDGPAAYEPATGTYRFDLRSQEADDRMHEPFQQPFARHGAALLLHGELSWAAGDWQFGLGVRDLGWLHWNGLPRQDLVLSSETRDVDADGFVIYRPLVQGRNSQDGTTRTLAGWWTARAAWAIDHRQGIEAALEAVPDFGVLPALAWRGRVGAADLTARWRFHEARLTLGFAWQGLAVRLGADRLGSAAHSRELALSYTRAW